MLIRRAEKKDIKRISELLLEVCKIHADRRPDIFKGGARKYSDSMLEGIIKNAETPVFVAVDEHDFVLGYCFCVYKITNGSSFMQDTRTLYIDDLCVGEDVRGKKIGTALFEYTKSYAKEMGFDTVLLNVWSFNESAVRFYESMGMSTLRTYMELKI